MNSDISLEKRYRIAEAINPITERLNLSDSIVQSIVINQFKKDLFNQESDLYKALNYQRNGPLAMTFFGRMSLISCNYARSLQAAQAMILESQQLENNNTASSHSREIRTTIEITKR